MVIFPERVNEAFESLEEKIRGEFGAISRPESELKQEGSERIMKVIEQRISGINSLVEEQIGRLEERVTESLEARIKLKNETTESKIDEINQKLELLLSILSK